MRLAPSTAPRTLPEPPKMLMPPTTTAATDLSSCPIPATTVMLPKRARKRNPVSPASAPQRTKAVNTSRRVGNPALWAASGLDPIA